MRELLSTTQVSEYLQRDYGMAFHPAQVRAWVELERFPAAKVGGAYVMDYDDVVEWFEPAVLTLAKRVAVQRQLRSKGAVVPYRGDLANVDVIVPLLTDPKESK